MTSRKLKQTALSISLAIGDRSARTVARRMTAAIAAGLGALVMLPTAQAAPVTVNYSGTVDFIAEYEYGTALPLPAGPVPILPYFNGATRITGSYTYDPSIAVDQNPDPSSGRYVTPGSFSMSLPDIGMTIAGSGTLGFSVHPASPYREFHVGTNAIPPVNLPFVGNAGGATPFSVYLVFYGAPLANDSLPTWPVSSPGFQANIGFSNVAPSRDILIAVTTVPEPESYAMMLAGLGLLGFIARRKQGRH